MSDHRVRPGRPVHLARLDPEHPGHHADKKAEAELERDIGRLAGLQDVLYAEHRRAVLIVLQGMDTAGKDGTIKHVMRGLNPSACEVAPFEVPAGREVDHDYLWRIHRVAPRRGHITIFNRSHYEDLIVPRVHRTLPKKAIEPRYAQINDFERILVENDTVIMKFFLHISRREQAKRLRERITDTTKRWKFSTNDLAERALWPRYMAAYEEVLSRCSTDDAPWYVIPANRKWYRNLAVARVVVDTLEGMRLQYPPATVPPERLRRIRL